MDVAAAPAVYGLEYSARALAAGGSGGETEDIHSFYVGTYSLKNENHLLVLQFNDDTEALSAEVYAYPRGQILGLQSCPSKPSLLGAVRTSTSSGNQAALHNVTDLKSGAAVPDLCVLQNSRSSAPVCLAWHPGQESMVGTVSENRISLFDLNDSSSSPKVAADWELPAQDKTVGSHAVSAARWSPHQNGANLAVAVGRDVVAIDTKSGATALHIQQAHYGTTRALDFNPLKAYYMATGGDDGTLRFWDVRQTSRPLAALSHHSHWIWSVRYNAFHDNFLLSSGSDSRVLLSNMASLSSDAPAGGAGPVDSHAGDEGDLTETQQRARRLLKQDCLLASYLEHEDSVYAAEWASGDPWMFASLSYDGRFVINRVPRDVKYSILLVQS